MGCPQFPHRVFRRGCLPVLVRQSVFRETSDVLPVRTVPAGLPKSAGLRGNYQACGAGDGYGRLLRLTDRSQQSEWVLVLIGEQCIAMLQWISRPREDLRGKESAAFPLPGVSWFAPVAQKPEFGFRVPVIRQAILHSGPTLNPRSRRRESH